jgi:hypothetical protein
MTSRSARIPILLTLAVLAGTQSARAQARVEFVPSVSFSST